MTDPRSSITTLPAKIRWAIVGTGAIATTFAEDMALARNAVLTAVCSRSAETGAAFARRFGDIAVFTDIDALAAEVDAVYIASPNTAHFGQASRLMRAGKPLLIEKPLTTSATDAGRLAETARESGVFVMEGLWTLHLPALERLRGLLQAEVIGAVKSVYAELAFAKPFDPESRFFAPALGGGALLDLGIYPIAVTLSLFGTPNTIDGHWKAAPTGVDMSADLSLGFDGFKANLHCSFERDGANRYVIEGETGTLAIDAPFLKASRILLMRNGLAQRLACPARNGPLPRLASKIARRLPLPGLQVFEHGFPQGGLQFEIEAASRAILAGAIEEPRTPLSLSAEILRIVDTVRAS